MDLTPLTFFIMKYRDVIIDNGVNLNHIGETILKQ